MPTATVYTSGITPTSSRTTKSKWFDMHRLQSINTMLHTMYIPGRFFDLKADVLEKEGEQGLNSVGRSIGTQEKISRASTLRSVDIRDAEG